MGSVWFYEATFRMNETCVLSAWPPFKWSLPQKWYRCYSNEATFQMHQVRILSSWFLESIKLAKSWHNKMLALQSSYSSCRDEFLSVVLQHFLSVLPFTQVISPPRAFTFNELIRFFHLLFEGSVEWCQLWAKDFIATCFYPPCKVIREHMLNAKQHMLKTHAAKNG